MIVTVCAGTGFALRLTTFVSFLILARAAWGYMFGDGRWYTHGSSPVYVPRPTYRRLITRSSLRRICVARGTLQRTDQSEQPGERSRPRGREAHVNIGRNSQLRLLWSITRTAVFLTLSLSQLLGTNQGAARLRRSCVFRTLGFNRSS